jgi:hypothetical protein
MTAPTPTAPPTPQPTASRPVSARPSAPNRLAVPAKPAAVTAGNAAALVTSVAMVAGPVAWTAAAAAGGVAASVYAARKIRRSRRAPRVGSAGGNARSGGRSGFRWPGFGGSRRSASSPSAGARGRATPTGRPAAPRPPGSKPSPRPRQPVSTRPNTRNRRPAGNPVTRASGRLARAIARGTGRALRWGALGLARLTGRALAFLWRAFRRAVRSLIDAEAQPQPAPPPVRDTQPTVNRPTEGTRPMPEPSAPLDQVPTGTSPLFVAARRLHAVAVDHEIGGMLEMRTEAHELPLVLTEVTAAIQARIDKCGQLPIEPDYAQALAAIAASLVAIATSSRRMGPLFDDLHAEKILRLLKPQINEGKWDTVQNKP